MEPDSAREKCMNVSQDRVGNKRTAGQNEMEVDRYKIAASQIYPTNLPFPLTTDNSALFHQFSFGYHSQSTGYYDEVMNYPLAR